jgi:MFS family permease
MDRFLAAFAALLFGCGIMAVLVGFLSDRYTWETGVLAGVGCCVLKDDQNR